VRLIVIPDLILAIAAMVAVKKHVAVVMAMAKPVAVIAVDRGGLIRSITIVMHSELSTPPRAAQLVMAVVQTPAVAVMVVAMSVVMSVVVVGTFIIVLRLMAKPSDVPVGVLKITIAMTGPKAL